MKSSHQSGPVSWFADLVTRQTVSCWIEPDGAMHTYGDLLASSARWAGVLIDLLGSHPQKVVAYAWVNGWHHAVITHAALRLGLALLPLQVNLPTAHQEELIARAGAVLLPEPATFFALAPKREPLDILPEADVPFVLAASSGTTSVPKLITLSAFGFLRSAQNFAQASGFSRQTRVYHVLPMSYMAGLMNALFAVFAAGGAVIEGPRFCAESALDFWKNQSRFNPNTFSVTPLIAANLAMLARDPGMRDRLVQHAVYVQSTSAPIPPSVRALFAERTGLYLHNVFGITECGGPATVESITSAASGDDWSELLPGFEAKIISDEAQLPELWLKSPFPMLGYWQDGQPHPSGVDADGYFATGDLAELDGRRLRIIGRSKECIKRGGVAVFPNRIEHELSQVLPEGVEIAVFAIPHVLLGEQIGLAIAGAGSTSEAIKVLLSLQALAKLSPDEQPQIFRFVESLPRLANGKLNRRALAAPSRLP